MNKLEQVATNAFNAFVKTKRDFCKNVGGPVDLSVQLDVLTPKGHIVAILPSRSLIVATCEEIREEAGSIEIVCFLADAYGRVAANEDEARTFAGHLGEVYEAGDMTVSEILIVTAMDVSTGEYVSMKRRYTYDDDGMPRFSQVERPTTTDESIGVVAEMRRLVR